MIKEKSILIQRCEAMHEMRLLTEEALRKYIKEHTIDTIGAISSISSHSLFKNNKFEGVDVRLKFVKRGKCGILESVIGYQEASNGSITFDKNKIQIKEF